MPIPGRHLDGIYFAMNFLESSQKKQLGGPTDLPLLARDKNIIVIGGGDTGCDCIATSLRQVSILSIINILMIFQFHRNCHIIIIIIESKIHYII